ncbi:NAC domain-containing protein 40-like isoform X2 [Dioscorea cayenensis subsp. rotundata]|uniref:NAC domain-containing protein 40-like isoform X2 n=1 Tax=Dioscorea cayennensis subsp. rotundata TaxID=55577 RepID=A0AB40CBF1_DIOCR|nr:NAC domain-containing protein 40-like isoform X2 [Dioscorea cayenensis subsp. rotundata]
MCPPPSDLLLFGDDALSSDEDIVSFLGGWKVGDPIPVNVIGEVDPLSIHPCHLPEGILYLCSSGDPQSCKANSEIKETSDGYWKSNGEDFRILANNLKVGRKTTWEFYSGEVPFGKKTGWMMHEYQAEQKPCEGIIATKESSFMCRIFRHSDQCLNCEGQHNSEHANCLDDADANSEAVEAMWRSFLQGDKSNHSDQDDENQTQVFLGEEQRELAITGGNRQDILVVDSSVDVDATDEFLEGDYIELDDLCSLASSSSSSDNSSIMLINSEEYLDVDAFNLRDLESESVHDTSEEHIESGFCMSTLSRPNQVLNNPPPTGLLNNSIDNLMVEERTSPLGNGLVSASTLSLLSTEPQCNGEASTSGTSHDNSGNQTLNGKVNGSPIRPDSSSVGSKPGKIYFFFGLF